MKRELVEGLRMDGGLKRFLGFVEREGRCGGGGGCTEIVW